MMVELGHRVYFKLGLGWPGIAIDYREKGESIRIKWYFGGEETINCKALTHDRPLWMPLLLRLSIPFTTGLGLGWWLL